MNCMHMSFIIYLIKFVESKISSNIYPKNDHQIKQLQSETNRLKHESSPKNVLYRNLISIDILDIYI